MQKNRHRKSHAWAPLSIILPEQLQKTRTKHYSTRATAELELNKKNLFDNMKPCSYDPRLEIIIIFKDTKKSVWRVQEVKLQLIM
jgi:hypothetical protein